MIDAIFRELHDVACGLRGRGYPKAAAFVMKHRRFMVTFAELALEGIEIPYTTNRIERLMGEVSKRYKHMWMHWSTRRAEGYPHHYPREIQRNAVRCI